MKKIFALVIALTFSAGTPTIASDVLSNRECAETKTIITVLADRVLTYESAMRLYKEWRESDDATLKATGVREGGKAETLRNKDLAVLANYSTVYGHLCKD